VALLLSVGFMAASLTRGRPSVGAPPLVSQVSGEPGPAAVGVPVNPHQFPVSAQDGASAQPQTVPPPYLVDKQTYERLKDQANAAAAADAAVEEAP
jgi:hypothetical protein